MRSLFDSIVCQACGHRVGTDLFVARCDECGDPWLEARYDLDALPPDWPDLLASRPADLWRYRELFPFPSEFQPVSLRAGGTPLIRARGLEQGSGLAESGGEIWIKDERRQPTGSFKDREAALAVNAAILQGIRELVLVSTGNRALAYAALCARAGIRLWVFVPNWVSAIKIREMGLYGAEVIRVTGSYDQARETAADFSTRHGLCFDWGICIPSKEGIKTVAFEIAEQLGATGNTETRWRAPDWYIQAVAGGLGPLAVYKGFTELCEAGLVDRLPKLGIVQVEGCAPMVRAWERGLAQAQAVLPDTLVSMLCVGNPGRTYEILKQIIDANGGTMVTVSDGEAIHAVRRIARREGIAVEPVASVAFAGLEKLLRQHVQPGESILVNCSGNAFSSEKHSLEERYTLRLRDEAGKGRLRPSRRAGVQDDGWISIVEDVDEQSAAVAIIEDNPDHCRILRRLIERHRQCDVLEANDGLAGLELVRARRPDLVILDLMVPGMDGFDVLEQLKLDENTRDIPVVVVSAKSLTPGEFSQLQRFAQSVWHKGDLDAHKLATHVAGILGDDPGPPLADGESDLGAFDLLRRPRILVIDDRASDARLMRRLFESRQRFDVTEVHSGEEALAAIRCAIPDLIVLDLLLPDIDGEQLLGRLRRRRETRDVPVIVVSAKDLDPPARERLATQVDSVWSKAMFDRESLLAHVETILPE